MKAIGFIFFLSITLQFALAQKDNRDLEQGNKLYKEQQFDKAAEAYEKVLVKAPKNSVANYNLGNTLYRKNNEAEATFNFCSSREILVKVFIESLGVDKVEPLHNKVLAGFNSVLIRF